MRFHFSLTIVVATFLLAGCAAPVVTPIATATIAPTPTSGIDPCLTTAKTYKPGSLPPGRIAFNCYNNPDIINIYVFDTTTGNIANLTNDTSTNSGSQWSPNGRQIAFYSNRNTRPGIYLMNANGSQLKWLFDGAISRWSPNGKRIAFVRDDKLYVMNGDEQQPTLLSDSLAPAGQKSWSPDSERLVFGVAPSGIHAIRVDGTQEITLTNYAADFGDIAWSPDGDYIYFLSAYDGPLELYRVAASGGQPIRLAAAPQYIDTFALSPDGQQAAFRDDSKKVYVVNSDGSQIRQVLDTSPNHLSWSPDGQYLVFATKQLAVVKVDTGQIITLTDSSAFKDYPEWSPR
jgi:TolB protein